MTEICTVSSVSGLPGLLVHGRTTREEIIRQTREFAAARKEEAEFILNARDQDFEVRVVEGVHKQRLIDRLLPSTDGPSRED